MRHPVTQWDDFPVGATGLLHIWKECLPSPPAIDLLSWGFSHSHLTTVVLELFLCSLAVVFVHCTTTICFSLQASIQFVMGWNLNPKVWNQQGPNRKRAKPTYGQTKSKATLPIDGESLFLYCWSLQFFDGYHPQNQQSTTSSWQREYQQMLVQPPWWFAGYFHSFAGENWLIILHC